MLAKDASATRATRSTALSLTFFASKLRSYKGEGRIGDAGNQKHCVIVDVFREQASLLQGRRANGGCSDLCKTSIEPLQEFGPAPLVRLLFE